MDGAPVVRRGWRERLDPWRRVRGTVAGPAGYVSLDAAVGADPTVCDWPAGDGDLSTHCTRTVVGALVVGGTRRHLCRRHRTAVLRVAHLFDLGVGPADDGGGIA